MPEMEIESWRMKVISDKLRTLSFLLLQTSISSGVEPQLRDLQSLSYFLDEMADEVEELNSVVVAEKRAA